MAKRSYKGILADDGQDRIRVRTNKGKVGYRITKLQLMGKLPAGANQESVVKITKVKQTSFSAIVDFTDYNLLAVAYLESAADAKTESQAQVVIFDNEVFNQDIYISHVDSESGESCNYYIELETIDLSDAQMSQVTLKSLRTLVSR